MFTEIRCEICINHFVEIIFTLSCAVVDINLLQINCSQIFLLKMCKKKLYRHPLIDINNINVPGQRIFFFFLLICYFCILMYNIPTRIFTDLYLKSKRQHFRVFVYKSNLYFFFHMQLQNFEFKNYLNHYLKRSDHFLGTLKFLHTVSVSSSDSLVIGFLFMFYK